MSSQELNVTNSNTSVAISGYIEKANVVRIKQHSEKYNKKAYEKAREKGNWHCEHCNIDVLLIRKKQHLKTVKHENAVANSKVTPQDAIINQIVELVTKLQNDHNIIPELIWKNLNPTHKINIEDASIKRCEESENIEETTSMCFTINKTKPIQNLTKDGCGCGVCYVPKIKKIKINKKPNMDEELVVIVEDQKVEEDKSKSILVEHPRRLIRRLKVGVVG